MNTRFFAITLSLAAAALCAAQTPTYVTPKAPVGLKPGSITYEDVAYPYPVKYLPLVKYGQAVNMAYMDVPPAGTPNGHTVVLFHGMNFAFGWLPGGGARATTPSDLSFTPYGRIGVLHLALMGAMGLVLLLHEPVAAVVMLGLCKTGLELGQRKRFDGADDCGAPNDP